ncbi:MAG: HIT family protein [Flavobacteriales bacterium]|nr:HIT family protein [Flavobacteriales bacterium]|tara:strand:- start:8689 stop:9078 length:390 start_codon:yes stop_codon:yes gene_type:complete
MNSVFSRIINKELPCYLISENKFAISFMDINPIAIGHVLVVPKVEVDYIFDLDPDVYHNLWDFTKKVSCALQKTISCERISISVIGLDVPHAHVHLVPINNISDVDFSNKIKITPIQLEKLAKKISSNI